MSDLEDVKEDLERICAEGDVLCCAALKCIRELEAAQGVAVTVSEAARVLADECVRVTREAECPTEYERRILDVGSSCFLTLRALAGQGGE